MRINYLVLTETEEPSFNRLKEIGWKHPIGLHGEELVKSLIKEYSSFTFQIVRHQTGEHSYMEIFVGDSEDYGQVRLKGKGSSFVLRDIIEPLAWLAAEIDLAREGEK